MLIKLLTKPQATKEKVAIIFDSVEIGYAELLGTASIIANNLYQAGLRKGSRLALFMDNRPELIYLYFAAFKLGVVIVPINYRYKPEELAYVLNDSQADMLITEASKEPYLDDLQLEHKKIFSISENNNESWKNYAALLNETTPPHPIPEIKETDLAMILYTSGSTAKPKGVMHTHQSAVAAATNVTQTIAQDHTCINGVTLPICHVAGLLGQVIATLLTGGTMVLFKCFEAQDLIDAIKTHKITHLQLVPVNLAELVEHVDDEFTSLQSVMVGGDKVPESLQQVFFKISQCYITEVMGMTESFSYCINVSHQAEKMGSVGKPAQNVKLKLIDDVGRIITQPNLAGEVCIQTDANTIGYWNNPQETVKTINDGWVYSGDLAYCDKDDFYWFVGRKKQLIIRGGSNIAPQEVEAVLIQHPQISEVAATAYPDKTFNNIVCVCIVLKDKYAVLSLDEIRSFCKNKLSDYKLPEKLIIVEELPHNASGKLDRFKIAKMP